jgi:hypothetical protein
MMLPDCRNDDYYNKDFLDGSNEEFVRGYDWATEAVDNLFNNMDSLTDGSDHIEKFLDEPLPECMQTDYEMDFAFQDQATEHRDVKTYGDFLRMRILEWLEMERNELITSMIDDMNEELYKAIRNRVLKDNAESDSPKEYYDTRKYVFTGKKESDGVTDEE